MCSRSNTVTALHPCHCQSDLYVEATRTSPSPSEETVGGEYLFKGFLRRCWQVRHIQLSREALYRSTHSEFLPEGESVSEWPMFWKHLWSIQWVEPSRWWGWTSYTVEWCSPRAYPLPCLSFSSSTAATTRPQWWIPPSEPPPPGHASGPHQAASAPRYWVDFPVTMVTKHKIVQICRPPVLLWLSKHWRHLPLQVAMATSKVILWAMFTLEVYTPLTLNAAGHHSSDGRCGEVFICRLSPWAVIFCHIHDTVHFQCKNMYYTFQPVLLPSTFFDPPCNLCKVDQRTAAYERHLHMQKLHTCYVQCLRCHTSCMYIHSRTLCIVGAMLTVVVYCCLPLALFGTCR